MVVIVATSRAQDSRSAAADRLHQLVDRRIEDLRAELHREIDAAFRRPETPEGLTIKPVSDEFRKLHRLPLGAGQRVLAVSGGSPAERLGILPGDVFLRAGRLATNYPMVWLIRNGERRTTPGIVVAAGSPTETAAQMVDRLWDEAVRNAMKNGYEEVRPGGTGPESQPARK